MLFLPYYCAGPVNNVLIVRQQLLPKSQLKSTSQGSLRKHRSLLPPALAKFENSKDEDEDSGVMIDLSGPPMGFSFLNTQVMENQIAELQVIDHFVITHISLTH